MCEMANLYPADTGLPVVVWFGEVGGQHGPRIKVSNTAGRFNLESNFVVSVSREPEVLTPRSAELSQAKTDDVKDWIRLNHDALMALWKIHESGDGDVKAALAAIQRI